MFLSFELRHQVSRRIVLVRVIYTRKLSILYSYSDTEDEENIDTDGPESSDSDELESLSYSVYKIMAEKTITHQH